MIANYAGDGHPPGLDGPAAAGRRGRRRARATDGRADGAPVIVEEPDVEGELALRPGWPSMFRGYLHDEERYRKCFAGGWYLTGDLARRDADGYYWFVGRADDVIKSAGHLIGPFEVESALMEHPAVAEAGVIGKPDPVAGEVVKAFVVAASRASSRARSCGASCSASPASASARRWRPRRSSSTTRCRTRAAARSCAACSRPASSACRRATCPPWRTDADDVDTQRRRRMTDARPRAARLLRRDAAHPPLRGDAASSSTAQRRSAASCTSTSARRPSPSASCRRSTPDDAVVATYREHGHALLRGVPMDAIMAEMFGKQEGCSRGRGGSMHLFDAATPLLRRQRDRRRRPAAGGRAGAGRHDAAAATGVTACFFGDGAVAEGEFHESLNLAALWRLPVLFCCENNLYAMGTALERSESQTDLTAKAASYGYPRSPSTGWTSSPATTLRNSRRPHPRRRGPVLPGVAHLPLPRALDVRPRALPRQGRGRAVAQARPDSNVHRACLRDDRPHHRRHRSDRDGGRARKSTMPSHSPTPERGNI